MQLIGPYLILLDIYSLSACVIFFIAIETLIARKIPLWPHLEIFLLIVWIGRRLMGTLFFYLIIHPEPKLFDHFMDSFIALCYYLYISAKLFPTPNFISSPIRIADSIQWGSRKLWDLMHNACFVHSG